MTVAVHEAGHIALAVIMGRRILFASVDPVGDTLGRVVFAERTVLNLRDHRQVEREAALHLAGFAAEMILDRQSVPTGCDDEVFYAFRLAAKIGAGREGFVRLVHRTTRALVAIWPTVLVVASELQRRHRLDGLVVRQLVRRELGLRRRWKQRSRTRDSDAESARCPLRPTPRPRGQRADELRDRLG